jgi:hypothetical protein
LLAAAAGYQRLNGFHEIFGEMKVIGNLDGLRSPFSGCSSIVLSAITAHERNFVMRLHPRRCGFRTNIILSVPACFSRQPCLPLHTNQVISA